MNLPDTDADMTDLQFARLLVEILRRLLDKILPTPKPRGKLRLLYLQETAGMAWKFSVGLPPLPASNAMVKEGELTVQVSGAEPVVTRTDREADSVGDFTGAAEANVKRTFVYIGTNGKRSDPLVVESTLPPASSPPTPAGELPLTDLSEVP